MAIEIIRQQGLASLHRLLLREVSCMKALHRPNTVQLYEVIGTEKSFFLIMEHVSEGNMLDYLKTHGRMRENEVRGAFFWQLVSAVHYCRQRGIAHRDLKPQNVLFNKLLTLDSACSSMPVN